MVVDSDPSQEAAVVKARSAPGLLVEGPPGTGKSQTIVNIIADCLGRKESVLVVCQKQAALRVVQKRLDAEKLGDRLFSIIDVNKDREVVIRQLRDQLGTVRNATPGGLTNQRHQRLTIAARMGALDTELNSHHESLYAVDGVAGMSYRGILGALIAIERDGSPPSVPSLRAHFSALPRERISEIEEICGPLAPLWMQSRYEVSALASLRMFSADDAIAGEVFRDLAAFVKAEAAREAEQRNNVSSFDLSDPAPFRAWTETHDLTFTTLPAHVRDNVRKWLPLFSGGALVGARLITNLGATTSTLEGMNETHVDASFLAKLINHSTDDIHLWSAIANLVTKRPTFFARLSIRRWRKRRAYNTWLEQLKIEVSDDNEAAMRRALALETQLRPLRKVVEDTCRQLALECEQCIGENDIAKQAHAVLATLGEVRTIVEAALASPRATEAQAMLAAGTPEAYTEFRRNIAAAISRYEARQRSSAAAKPLEQWFEQDWVAARFNEINHSKTPYCELQAIAEALPTLVAYQRFRARATLFDEAVRTVFAVLRAHEEKLSTFAAGQLEQVVRGIITREAHLAWKARVEQLHPTLTLEREELERKVQNLSTLEAELLDINRRLLAADIDPVGIGPDAEWEAITRLRGPRTHRLREIIDRGAELGLMSLRPIWLMNPDTLSRVLPLRSAQFDVVIFDEASQMLVEHAVPALFRAKRVVISSLLNLSAELHRSPLFDGHWHPNYLNPLAMRFAYSCCCQRIRRISTNC